MNGETQTALIKPKKRHFEDLRKHKSYYIMLTPMVLFFLAFAYLPMPGLYFAFVDFDFLKMYASPFIGLKNFEFLFNGGMHSVIWQLTMNTVSYNVVFIITGTIGSVALAIVLSEIKQKFFVKVNQTLMFLPHFVSMVIVGVIVYNIFNYRYGVINNVLTSMGFQKYDFYQNPEAWPIIIVLINLWKSVGYNSIIYLAAILGIDESVYEAAYIDGASNWQRIKYITIPLLIPTIILLTLLSLGGILKGQFDLFYQIIGNNGLLLNSTDIIDTYVYRSLAVDFNMGRGSAAGLYQSLFGFVLVLSVNKIVDKLSPENAIF